MESQQGVAEVVASSAPLSLVREPLAGRLSSRIRRQVALRPRIAFEPDYRNLMGEATVPPCAA